MSSSASAQENLRVLELDNCQTITDVAIDHLFAFQNLKRLDIFDCQQISKNAVKKIQVCPLTNSNHRIPFLSLARRISLI